jgi:hypothetical protein
MFGFLAVKTFVAHPPFADGTAVKLQPGLHIGLFKRHPMLLLPQQLARFFMVNGAQAARRKSHGLACPLFSATVAKKAERKPFPVGMVGRFLCQRLAHVLNYYRVGFILVSQNFVVFWVERGYF